MNIRQTLAQWFYSPGAYGLWVALDDVENWEYRREGEYLVYLDRTGKKDHYGDRTTVAVIYVGHGPFAFNGDPSKGTPKFVGLLERWPLWFKYKRLNNRRMLYRFTRLEDPK
jgi:hypothetical protein